MEKRLRNSRFLEQLQKSNEKQYLLLVTIYFCTYLISRICWEKQIGLQLVYVRIALMSLVIWGSAVYLFCFIADWKMLWKKTGYLIILASIIVGSAGLFSKFMTFRTYTLAMDFFFCVFAGGKQFKKIIRCGAGAVTGALVIAGIGELLGITKESPKPERVSAGLSLGTIYPNTWAYLIFLAAMLIWYLIWQSREYNRKRVFQGVLTFSAFWGLAAIIYYVSTSRTIAALCVLFPLMYFAAEWQGRRSAEGNHLHGSILWITAPFLCLGLTLFLCWQMEWVHDVFYNTFFHTMAMRFVEGGNTLRMDGITLFSRPLEIRTSGALLYTKEIEYIVDNAYIADIILRGALWMICCMFWIAAAHIKCIKNRDWPLLAISTSILIFGLMERPALDVWYNLVLLYPLSNASYPRDTCHPEETLTIVTIPENLTGD